MTAQKFFTDGDAYQLGDHHSREDRLNSKLQQNFFSVSQLEPLTDFLWCECLWSERLCHISGINIHYVLVDNKGWKISK